VARLEVASRNDVLGGRSFGEAGAYERLKGKVYFSIAVPIVTTRRAAVASTIALHSPREMRSPRHRWTFLPTSSFSQINLKPIPGQEKRAGLIDQAVVDKVVPKIFFSNTSYEYWEGRPR